MNTNDFYKYIENADLLNASTVAELQDVLKAYPYFQTAHFLYLKSLYNQNNFKFNEQLKFSSVHVNNRKQLLFFLKDKLQVRSLNQVSEAKEDEQKLILEGQLEKIPEDLVVEEPFVKERTFVEELFEEDKVPEDIAKEPLEMTSDEPVSLEEKTEESKREDFLDKQTLESDFEKSSNNEITDFVAFEAFANDLNQSDSPGYKEALVGEKNDEQLTQENEFKQSEEDSIGEEIVFGEGRVEEKVREDEQKASVIDSEKTEQSEKSILSPQEIIAKRIREINAEKLDVSGKEFVDKQSVVEDNDVSLESDIKVESEKNIHIPEQEEIVESASEAKINQDVIVEDEGLEDASEIQEDKIIEPEITTTTTTIVPNVLVSSFDDTKEEKELEEDVVDLSGLIAVAAPSEYFLEVSDELPNVIKDIKKEDVSDDEKYSFEGWLSRLSTVTNRAEKAKVSKVDKKPKKKEKSKKLIDRFLSDKGSKVIKPKVATKTEKKGAEVKSVKEPESGFMTETLADIYIKQAYYEKAIEAYTKLSLKYPKKSSYFANQIKKVKELQLNS